MSGWQRAVVGEHGRGRAVPGHHVPRRRPDDRRAIGQRIEQPLLDLFFELVDAFGLDGAVFTAEPDPETNFRLFGPVPSAATAAETTSSAYALRLRPNQDFAGALEAFCRGQGITHAKLHGGVGSTIGARFADGRIVEPFATELAVRSGIVAPGAGGALEAELDIALVDYTGGVAEGRLTRGDNPVLMTMELVLEVVGEVTKP